MRPSNVFEDGEADAWYRRNADHLARYDIDLDVVAGAISCAELNPPRIYDVGCASGERLQALCERYRADGVGIDLSPLAIDAACRRTKPSDAIEWLTGSFDWLSGTPGLVICSFVLHWVPRDELIFALQSIDHAASHVVINDFYSDVPVKNPYHHRTDVQTYTYKEHYADMLLATRRFRLLYHQTYRYDATDRAAVTVLERIDDAE